MPTYRENIAQPGNGLVHRTLSHVPTIEQAHWLPSLMDVTLFLAKQGLQVFVKGDVAARNHWLYIRRPPPHCDIGSLIWAGERLYSARSFASEDDVLYVPPGVCQSVAAALARIDRPLSTDQDLAAWAEKAFHQNVVVLCPPTDLSEQVSRQPCPGPLVNEERNVMRINHTA
jgi:hypothetical protein